MRKLQKLRGAITALLSVAALVSGLTSSKADIIDTFSVSDQLVSASFSLRLSRATSQLTLQPVK